MKKIIYFLAIGCSFMANGAKAIAQVDYVTDTVYYSQANGDTLKVHPDTLYIVKPSVALNNFIIVVPAGQSHNDKFAIQIQSPGCVSAPVFIGANILLPAGRYYLGMPGLTTGALHAHFFHWSGNRWY